MRTTIRLDDRLFREIKASAAKSGQSLNAFFEESARMRLTRKREKGNMPRIRLPTFKGLGVQPGVDLGSNASLLELMEGGRGSL